ncbi:hypothetical protein LJR016_002285 [Devosia sp. LjRoot16]|uniref:hypothetical protein n=1 Tax=Devosia sp. LjRoot16 TaxID=3342271 RepID=UPI003ECECBED
MPETHPLNYRGLSPFEQGYADALIDNESNGDHPELWEGIGVDDFSQEALDRIGQDCRKFMRAAVRAWPLSEEEMFSLIDAYDLGRHFYLERQCTGVGINEMALDDLGDRLIRAAAVFDWVVVEIDGDRKIRFVGQKLSEDPAI